MFFDFAKASQIAVSIVPIGTDLSISPPGFSPTNITSKAFFVSISPLLSSSISSVAFINRGINLFLIGSPHAYLPVELKAYPVNILLPSSISTFTIEVVISLNENIELLRDKFNFIAFSFISIIFIFDLSSKNMRQSVHMIILKIFWLHDKWQ